MRHLCAPRAPQQTRPSHTVTGRLPPGPVAPPGQEAHSQAAVFRQDIARKRRSPMTTLSTLPLTQMKVVPDLLAAPVGTVLLASEISRDEPKIVIRSRLVSAEGTKPGLILMTPEMKGYFAPDEFCTEFVRSALDVTEVMPAILTRILPGFRYKFDAVVRGDVWHLQDEKGQDFAGLAIGSDEEESKVFGYARITDGRIGDIIPAKRLAYLGQLDFAAAPAKVTV
ncbi:hypothetical protein NO263_12575 [Gluconacetobacter entanii]|uniref:Uncharacterized protein n=1 Tax=Gluconacetobacter entanii TaxID=108528 RepID=A0ABT3K7M6_9PROT|nr:hypothetical protein [Gluconacetobacter entanii]MCW4591416.1 hypothetical protein [Gluconacetobacter entanii]MCW4594958.1 hypothetical protein [Gluconacetobacter entanii]